MQTICRGSKCAVHCVANDTNVDHAVHMTNQGGRFCLVAFPKKPVNFNLGYLAVSTFIFMKSVGKEGMLLLGDSCNYLMLSMSNYYAIYLL